MDLAQRATKNGEILAKDVDQAAFDLAPPGDDTIAEVLLLLDAKTRGPVGHKHVEFSKCPGIQ